MLAAHQVRLPNPKAVIIFLSGIRNPSVTAFFGHARWLAGHGYASLLLEMRAHGESEGDLICLGYREHLDVRAAVDYLRAGGAYDAVLNVVYGLSMGGAAYAATILGFLERHWGSEQGLPGPRRGDGVASIG